MMQIFDNFLMFILGIIGLSFLVFVHELGHFIVAKKNGVRVKTFSIGFGKKLIRFRRGETEYCISLIPFGGYVAMAGENPEETEEGQEPDPGDFASKPVGVRAAIAFAGPFINIVFALLLLAALYMKGVQEPVSDRLVVGFVGSESAAEAAGVLPGDTILSLEGKPVQGWDDFRERIGSRLGASVPLEIHRNDSSFILTLVPRELMIPKEDSSEQMIGMGIGDAGIYPRHRVIVRETPLEGTQALLAGIQKGDTILEINGTHISSYDDVVFQVNQSSGADLLFTILRGKVTVRGADTIRGVDTIPITMRAVFDEESKRYMVGIQMAYVMFQETHLVRRNPVAASVKAAKTSWKMTSSIFIYFKRLAQGQVKADAFSGPVTIVAVMGRVWMSGFDQFLMLLALISVNLGVMNLLPLAITDGGLLMFLGIEKIRGRPLSQGKQVIIQKIAILFFISFFVFITILDFEKIGLFLKR